MTKKSKIMNNKCLFERKRNKMKYKDNQIFFSYTSKTV